MTEQKKIIFTKDGVWPEVSQNGIGDHSNDMDMSSCDEAYSSANSYDNTPAQVDRHLEFLDINNGGNLLMGSSSLVGRYWSGSIWYYDNLSQAPLVEGSKSGMEFPAGVTEGAFLEENSVVVGMDGGMLEFISIHNNGSRLSKEVSFDEYGSAVSQVKVCSGHMSILTASTDSCIRVFDRRTTSIKMVYRGAHSLYLTSISPHPIHPELFLSSSLDGTVLLWDMRENVKPACCIYENYDSPMAISWINNDSNQILIGLSSGTIKLCNANRSKQNIHSLDVFQKPVYRFVPNKFRENTIACCADDTKVAVLGAESNEIIIRFEEDKHSDFARGLAWRTDHDLMSCGWDKEIHRYSIH